MWVWVGVEDDWVLVGILAIVMMLVGVSSAVGVVEVFASAGGEEVYDLVSSASIEELREVGLGLGKSEAIFSWVLSSTVYVSVRSISIEELRVVGPGLGEVKESEVHFSLEGINL